MNAEVAWAAGLFEGEGYFRRAQVGARVYLAIGIEMRDRDVVERFVSILKRHGVTAKAQINTRQRSAQNPDHSDMCVWKVTGSAAADAYALMRPWLGQRRRTVADAIVAEGRAARALALAPRPCEHCHQPFLPKKYAAKRFCSRNCTQAAKMSRPDYRARANERNRRYKAKLKARRRIAGTQRKEATAT